MKILKKVLPAVVVFIVIAAVVGVFYKNKIAERALPDYNKSVEIPGLENEVTVIRDAYGVPSIYAQSDADLYKATGYLMAQDRLWQMDLLRRVTQGRLSEIFGEDMLKTDLVMRAIRIEAKSDMVLDSLDQNTLAALKAYAEGVNIFIRENKDKLPLEFTILGYEPEEWEPKHSVNLIGYMAWDLTMSWISEIRMYKFMQMLPADKFKQLIPIVSEQPTAVFPDFGGKNAEIDLAFDFINSASKLEELGLGVFEASNNWAVAGKKSTTGNSILSNDMHLGLFAPGIWYQMHQVIEGKLNVTGVALPGAPSVVAGHNDSIAWGFTNIMVDDMDFYEETINPENPNQYKFNGEWRDLVVKKEIFKVKGGKEIEREIKFTHRGPIVSEITGVKDKQISMRWTGNGYSNELRTIYLANRANIGLYSCMGLPLREGNRMAIAPGDTDKYDWKGYVPFDELPHEYNPERGYVASANNKTTPESYPHYISYWFDLNFRIDRIKEMLEAKDKLSVEDFKAMLTDHNSPVYDTYYPKLKAVLAKSDLSEMEKKAFDLLEKWDGNFTKESSATAIFENFYFKFVANVTFDEFKDEELRKEFLGNKILVRNLVKNIWDDETSAWFDNIDTKEVETLENNVLKSFKDAVAFLAVNFKNDPEKWQWGKMHTLTLAHPMGKVRALDLAFNLNRGPYEVGGSFHTVSPYAYSFNSLFNVNHGASHRHLFSAANWDDSYALIPTGIFRPDFFSKEKIEQNKKYSMVLKPAN